MRNLLWASILDSLGLRISPCVCAYIAVAFLSLDTAYGVTTDESRTVPHYPSLSEQHGVRQVLYLDGPVNEVTLPNGLPDVAIDYPHAENGAWILPLLFSGKRLHVATFDRQRLVVTLQSGASIRLLGEPADRSWERDASISGHRIAGMQLGDGYRRTDGARFAFESFVNAAVKDDGMFRCDGVTGGVVRLDAKGQALWRKTYVSEERDVSEADWGFCEHFRGQRQVIAQRALVGFFDGTVGVLVGRTLLRVSAETGLPLQPVPDVRVVDSSVAAAFRTGAYAKLLVETDTGQHASDAESQYYKLQAQFFFPEKE
jgi:hypothetical protein